MTIKHNLPEWWESELLLLCVLSLVVLDRDLERDWEDFAVSFSFSSCEEEDDLDEDLFSPFLFGDLKKKKLKN